MVWQPVDSSHLAAIDYDEDRQVLSVRFRDGAEWDYHGVEPHAVETLVNSDSPGTVFNAHIKGRHHAVKIGGDSKRRPGRRREGRSEVWYTVDSAGGGGRMGNFPGRGAGGGFRKMSDGTVKSVGLTSSSGDIIVTGSPSPITDTGAWDLFLPNVGVAGEYSVVTFDAKGRPTFGGHVSLSGDVTGIEANGVIPTKLKPTAVIPGSYTNTNLTVGADGRLTAATNGSGGGSGITALTGDITATGPGSVPATLPTVNANVGSFTNASVTVNAKGQVTAASSGTSGTFRGALVSKNAQQTINTGAVTALTWQTVGYDTSSFFSAGANTRLTVPAGVSYVRALANFNWVAGNFRRTVLIRKNGLDFIGQGRTDFLSGLSIEGSIGVVSAVVSVVATDYFEAYAFQNSAGDQKIDNIPGTWFAIEVLQ